MIDYKVFSLSDILDNFSDKEDELKEIFKNFSCPLEKELENFLLHSAIEYQKIQFGKTFLFLNAQKLIEGKIDIMAYFTTGQKAIDISKMSQKKKHKVIGSSIPGRDNLKSIAGYLIGELGRDERYSSTDLPGEEILKECYKRIEDARKIVGGNLIVLECRRKMFSLFYEKQGFKKISEEASDKGRDLIMLYRKIN
ncbi:MULTISPECIES: hypothetical protein [Liquorilactobacillus]|uniref:hypothetical protein n=1 Tax=Liquorilactobacillus TaxID=2767888 RepID=UPI0039E8E765